ncbi:MAG: FecR domain-containing protein [Rectinemataceae bacterium]
MCGKKTIAFLLAAFVGLGLASAEARITELRGKVEFRVSAGSDWQPAAVGSKLPAGGSISTGFNSMAVLDLGHSVVTVKALTRISLSELAQSGSKLTTRLALRVGAVNASIKTGEGLSQDFSIKSPVSTAAVRGTRFDFDGENLTVQSGLVSFSNLVGEHHSLGAGEHSTIGGFTPPSSGGQSFEALSTVPTVTGPSLPAGAAGGTQYQPTQLNIVLQFIPPPS